MQEQDTPATAPEGQEQVNFNAPQPEPEKLPAEGDVNSLDLSDLYGLPPDQFTAAAQQRVQETLRKGSARFTKKFQELATKRQELEQPATFGKKVAEWLVAEQQADPKLFDLIRTRLQTYAEAGKLPTGAGNGDGARLDPSAVKTKEDLLHYMQDREKTLKDQIVEAVRSEFRPIAQSYQEDTRKRELTGAFQGMSADLRAKGGEVLDFWGKNPSLTAKQALYAVLGDEIAARQKGAARHGFSEQGAFEEGAAGATRKYKTLEALIGDVINERAASR